ncbi:hypothetical protein IMZ11_21495 [Microtetraspora sp. AC03309]|uniref:hypothetical protein n=1 Tax=Microtetraspora sp. AC03309 TaxID=2779376 RepID=UPI001E31856B|nr:hypothetical protein [Microtetraspora sp. AC03309]MCC5578204.1 hypothetical protein [Microtetraspora sp. AC03309]
MQYDLVGSSAIYDVTACKFSVYLKWRDGIPLTVADAQRLVHQLDRLRHPLTSPPPRHTTLSFSVSHSPPWHTSSTTADRSTPFARTL